MGHWGVRSRGGTCACELSCCVGPGSSGDDPLPRLCHLVPAVPVLLDEHRHGWHPSLLKSVSMGEPTLLVCGGHIKSEVLLTVTVALQRCTSY